MIKRIKILRYASLTMIILFTILSGFPCIERWSRSTMIAVPLSGKIEWTIIEISNAFMFMLIIGILEGLSLIKTVYKLPRARIAVSVIRAVVTMWIPYMVLDGSLLETIMSDIEMRYKITPIGCMVVILSWLILMLEIRLNSAIQGSQSEVDN